ncbi:MAG: holo-ACP synthase [Alphaproteobacteria bacterium]|nr:holo-ACP synthase [Alphaproteobacteria bacterium]
MIAGLGCDIVNIERINKSEKFLEHFQSKILGPLEQEEIRKRLPLAQKEYACLLAKYYAAKEAFVKALGTGFRDGIFLKDIQITHNSLGKPELKISGTARSVLKKTADNFNLLISLTDDYPYAEAVVIIDC